MRRGWKRGDHLVMDEESGFTTYASKVAYDYYGVLKLKKQGDRAHPQDFIRAKEDPYPVYPIHPPLRQYENPCASIVGFFVGDTSVPTPDGPALHLFRPGIGEAEIECTFFVY